MGRAKGGSPLDRLDALEGGTTRHTIGSKVEAAYQRSDMYDKRRRLMTAWGSYCTTASAP